MLHAFQWCQRHVEVTVRAAPKGAQTLAVEILGVLHITKYKHWAYPSAPLISVTKNVKKRVNKQLLSEAAAFRKCSLFSERLTAKQL